MKRGWIVAMAAVLVMTLGVALSAQAKGKSCPMKDKKGKQACCMGMDLKSCAFTDKKEGKDDKPCWVCPDRCFVGKGKGKCPECGKALEKKFCPAMKDKKGKQACCMGMDLKSCAFTDKKEGKDDKPCWVCPDRCFVGKGKGKCPECGKALEKKFCPAMKGAKGLGACCVGKDGKQNCVCPKCQCKDGKPCDCKKCCKAWKDGKCPMKKGREKGKKGLENETES